MRSIKLLLALCVLLVFSLVAHNYISGRALDPRAQVERSGERERKALDRSLDRKRSQAKGLVSDARSGMPKLRCSRENLKLNCKGKAFGSGSACKADLSKASNPALACRP